MSSKLQEILFGKIYELPLSLLFRCFFQSKED